eukprot:12008243-Alexandrium_andersonii.AAC.1
MSASLVGSEMCIRDSRSRAGHRRAPGHLGAAGRPRARHLRIPGLRPQLAGHEYDAGGPPENS